MSDMQNGNKSHLHRQWFTIAIIRAWQNMSLWEQSKVLQTLLTTVRRKFRMTLKHHTAQTTTEESEDYDKFAGSIGFDMTQHCCPSFSSLKNTTKVFRANALLFGINIQPELLNADHTCVSMNSRIKNWLDNICSTRGSYISVDQDADTNSAWHFAI